MGIKPDLTDENHKIDLSRYGIDRSEIQIDRSESDRALPNERTGTGRSKDAARFVFVLHNAQGSGSIDPKDRSIDPET